MDRYHYGLALGAALGALAGGIAGLGGAPGWLWAFWGVCLGGAIGGFVANAVPDWRSWRRMRTDRPLREATSTTGQAVSEWIRREVRRAGIDGARSGGGGTVSTEPVLVSWTTGYSRFETRVYDRHGNSLAATTERTPAWRSLRDASTWRPNAGLGEAKLFVDRSERRIVTVLSGGAGNRQELSVVGADGRALGVVSLADHSIMSADGEIVGWARRMGRWGLRWAGPRFAIEDDQRFVVGHVTRTMSSGRWSTCNVTEFEQQAPEAVRALALAIDEAVTAWLAPTHGGG